MKPSLVIKENMIFEQHSNLNRFGLKMTLDAIRLRVQGGGWQPRRTKTQCLSWSEEQMLRYHLKDKWMHRWMDGWIDD